MRRRHHLHGWLIGRARQYPWALAVDVLPLPGGGWFACQRVHTGFMPKVDEGGFVMDYYTAPGTSLDETDRQMLALSRIATPCLTLGQPEIVRADLQPMIPVTGRIEGRGLGAVIAQIRRSLATPGLLSAGVRSDLGGLYERQQIAFAGLLKVFCGALVAEILLLMLLYRSLAIAGCIVGCTLLSTLAVFIALWLAVLELNVTALMGMTMVIGIGAEMAVFLVSEAAVLAGELRWPEALGVVRSRDAGR